MNGYSVMGSAFPTWFLIRNWSYNIYTLRVVAVFFIVSYAFIMQRIDNQQFPVYQPDRLLPSHRLNCTTTGRNAKEIKHQSLDKKTSHISEILQTKNFSIQHFSVDVTNETKRNISLQQYRYLLSLRTEATRNDFLSSFTKTEECDTEGSSLLCCPRAPFMWEVCDVTCYAQPNINTSRSTRSGVFFIGKSDLIPWNIRRGTHLIILNKNCSLKDSKHFTRIKDAVRFLDQGHKGDIVAGVVEGANVKLLLGKLGVRIGPPYSQLIFPFLVPYGAPGLGKLTTIRQFGKQVWWFGDYLSGPRYKMLQEAKSAPEIKNVDGGHWAPHTCQPRWRIALVVPYRNRETHLATFLPNIINFLQKQKVEFSIYVIEQTGAVMFNRAALMNAGFLEISKKSRYDCYVFHDVDLIPLDLSNLYGCTISPRHMAPARDHLKFRLRYEEYFGGAVMLREEHMRKMNGFSNKFYGWGGEDDNAYLRVLAARYNVTRLPTSVASYTMLRHSKDTDNPHRNRRLPFTVLHNVQHRGDEDLRTTHLNINSFNSSDVWGEEYRPDRDGLHTVNYTVVSLSKHQLFTRILVNLPGPAANLTVCNTRYTTSRRRPINCRL